MAQRGAEPPGPVHPFGAHLRTLRVRCGLSQTSLARRAEVDPAYVNRLERQAPDGPLRPSRAIVLALYAVLLTAGEEVGAPIGHDDQERLLVAAGLCPEVIVLAGGWDGYLRRLLAAAAGSEGGRRVGL